MSVGELTRIPGNFCTVHGYHYPKPLRTVRHHITPLAFGGPDTSANLVLVCDTGHYNIHAYLEWLIKPFSEEPKATRKEKALAKRGYDGIPPEEFPKMGVPGPFATDKEINQWMGLE